MGKVARFWGGIRVWCLVRGPRGVLWEMAGASAAIAILAGMVVMYSGNPALGTKMIIAGFVALGIMVVSRRAFLGR